MSLKSKVDEMQAMLAQGKMMDAFEKFYAENCVMQENNEEPRVGKDANRKFEIEWLASVEELHGAEIKNLAVNEESGVAMIQSWMDASFKGMGRMQMEEVAVQKWEDGQIVHEKFFYNRG